MVTHLDFQVCHRPKEKNPSKVAKGIGKMPNVPPFLADWFSVSLVSVSKSGLCVAKQKKCSKVAKFSEKIGNALKLTFCS